jgi:hypothetical protein
MDADVGETLGEVPVEYQPGAGGSFALVGMFDRSYEEQGIGQSRLDNRGPSVLFRGTEVAKLPVSPEEDDPTLFIGGESYQVRKRVNDGPTGRGVRLMLHRIGA